MKSLQESSVEKVQAMIELSFSKLYDLEKYYVCSVSDATKDGYEESAGINREKLMQVMEAIQVKKGMKNRPGII